MGLPTRCLALALCVFLPSATPAPGGLATSLDLLTSLDRIDQALPLQDRKKRKGSGSGSSSSGSKSGSGSGSSFSYSESGSAESFTDALAQILGAAAAGSDLLPIFAALALGSVPNPITNPLDFTTNPLVTALTQAASSADATQAARDLAAALLTQFFGQARLAQDDIILS